MKKLFICLCLLGVVGCGSQVQEGDWVTHKLDAGPREYLVVYQYRDGSYKTHYVADGYYKEMNIYPAEIKSVRRDIK